MKKLKVMKEALEVCEQYFEVLSLGTAEFC
jgi:hypothetical protein